MTVKIGEGVVPLNKFLPDLSAYTSKAEVDWKTFSKTEKLILRRVAVFRRNRKRIVGEIHMRAVIEPDSSEEEPISDVPNVSSMELEEDLLNVVSLLADNGFVSPESLEVKVLSETLKDCNIETLVWYILSKNSPLMKIFGEKRKFTNLELGDWGWGGKNGIRPGTDEDDFELNKSEKLKIASESKIDQPVGLENKTEDQSFSPVPAVVSSSETNLHLPASFLLSQERF